MFDQDLKQRLKSFGQEGLLRFHHELSPQERETLQTQINALDFELISRLYEESKRPVESLDPSELEPLPVIGLPQTDADRALAVEARMAGYQAIADGRVGVVLVAGGQGSRLGFERPKGMFPVGPVNGTSLFQIFAESILAWSRRIGRSIPWSIMTSDATHNETVAYFEEHGYFGLPAEDVRFFRQGTMPAVHVETGEVLLAEKGKLFASPNGHGGTLWAMRDEGVLADYARRGVDLIYYFQVDNPLAKILDPVFLGHHLRNESEFSVKVVRKRNAAEKTGVVVRRRGRPAVVEYSDLPKELMELTDDKGGLVYGAGNIAIHLFNREFVERIVSKGAEMPFHFAKKKVPHVDPSGQLHEPERENAIKFEMFIFDAMPLAEMVTVVETSRDEEFAPVKNATGDDSPEESQRAMTRQAAKWLRAAGVDFPVDHTGEPAIPLEISPLAGLTADEFAEWLADRQPVVKPTYFTVEDKPLTLGDH